jgi:peptidoglycan/LPS O-acetylase OafA/YrhL
MNTSPSSRAPSPAPTIPAGHRAHLDGIRAVAVYLVVAFHAGIGRFGGGHVGVDVFFVLSGYLVTGVLLREVNRSDDHGGSGDARIRFGRFYARRARRLLPAALVALLVTVVAYQSIASPIEVLEAERGFQAAAVYLTNWYLIDNATSYFAADVEHSPILHFWSLAVEEQFYLVWPLLFAGIVAATRRLGRHRWNAVRVVVALGGLASVGWAWSIRASDPNRAYYGTDTRAYQLLLGALLALTPWAIDRLRRLGPLNAVFAATGLGALLAVSIWGTRTGPVTRGVVAALATVLVLAALETGRAGVVARALSWSPIEYLGRISYGTYLWHWPVIVLAQIVDPDRSPVFLAGLSVIVATGIASLSYQVMEHPIRSARRLDRVAWPVAISGLALSVAAGLLVIPRMIEQPTTAVAAPVEVSVAVTDRFTAPPTDFDAVKVRFDGYGDATRCLDVPLSECIVVDGDRGTIVLMGDSNAQMWIPAFTAAARILDARLYVLLDDGCSWQRGIYIQNDEVNARCRRMKDLAYSEHLPEIRPDLLVLTNAREWRSPDTAFNPKSDQHRRIRRETASSLDRLRTLATEVLVVEHMVRPTETGFDPLECLGEASVIESCRFISDSEPTFFELDVRALAQRSPNLTSADFDRLACPFSPICDAMIDGIPVFWNDSHLSTQWTATLGDEVADYLESQELLPAGP